MSQVVLQTLVRLSLVELFSVVHVFLFYSLLDQEISFLRTQAYVSLYQYVYYMRYKLIHYKTRR